MNPALRTVVACAITFVVAAGLCIGALIASATVNPDTIMDSIRRDYDQIYQRGDYPTFLFDGMPKYRYDGFTDGIMMLQSIPDRNRSALENAVMAPYFAIGPGTGGSSPTEALLEKLSDPAIEDDRTYVLYWHGYVVPLRILLSFLSPMTIIALNCIVFAVLVALVFEAFRRTGGLAYGIAFIVALFATFSWIVPFGFQFFASYLIAFIATLVLYWILHTKRHSWVMPLFLVAGLLTAFFDFLVTPLLTFLLPLALYLLWCIKEGRDTPFLKVCAAGVAWLVGYAGFWVSKWLMTAVVHSVDYANSEFLYAVGMRSGAGGGISYRLGAIYSNLHQLFILRPDAGMSMSDITVVLVVVLTALTAVWWFLVSASGTSSVQIKRALPLLLVAAGPYVWYFVMAQHSTFHSWMTYRLQTASVLAVIFFVLLSIDWSKLRRSKKAKG